MSIATEIARLQQAKADIAEAIVAKGGEVSGTLDTYAQAIEALPSGGGDYLHQTLAKTLTSIDMSGWDDVSTIIDSQFRDCPLTDVKFPQSLTTLKDSCFRSCKITEITFPASLTTIGIYVLLSNPIKQVVCLAKTPPTVGASAFPSGVQFYVPDDAVDTYKSATYWSGQASRIHPLSELPQ